MNPLLTIVIPTRNREYYCIEAIKNILAHDNKNFELVIQDNSDSERIRSFVSQLNDDRLVYNYIAGRINSVLNMDMALSLASGKYVIMIGDDDTILPCIFDVVEWMEINKISVFSPIRQQAFFWNQDGTGTYITFPVGSKTEMFDAKKQLSKLLNNGIIDYQSFCLPRVYHGIVKRELLIEIKNRTSYYIGGLSPDIYLSVAIALLIDSYIVANFPISIQGVCVQSTAFAGKNGMHRGKLKDAPHFYKRGEYKWNEKIPALYSVETIWAETALKAIEEVSFDPDKWLSLFDQNYFYTVFELKNRELCRLEHQMLDGFNIHIFDVFRYFGVRIKVLFRSLFWRVFRLRKVYYNVAGWNGVVEIENDTLKNFR